MVLLPPSCALHPNADAVAFLGPRFHSWETYQNGSDYLGGEAYWAAGMDYVLRHVFNITVHFYNLLLLDGDDSSYWYKRPLSQYHRVVVDAVDTHRFLTEHRGSVLRTMGTPLVQRPIFLNPAVMCRSRFFMFWPHRHHSRAFSNPVRGFDERSVLTPYHSDVNTPMPIWPTVRS